MKKKVYTRPVSVVFSAEMFDQLLEVTNLKEIGLSDFIREAVREKLQTEIRTEEANRQQLTFNWEDK